MDISIYRCPFDSRAFETKTYFRICFVFCFSFSTVYYLLRYAYNGNSNFSPGSVNVIIIRETNGRDRRVVPRVSFTDEYPFWRNIVFRHRVHTHERNPKNRPTTRTNDNPTTVRDIRPVSYIIWWKQKKNVTIIVVHSVREERKIILLARLEIYSLELLANSEKSAFSTVKKPTW